MKRTILIFFAALVSCGGPKMDGAFPPGCRPYDLSVSVDSGQMTLKWKKECGQPTSGYNIYISTEPLAPKYGMKQIPTKMPTFNQEIFPGDTNPDDSVEIFEAAGLSDGVKYYVSVRIILPNGVQSKSTREIETVCGPSGEIELSARFKSEQDGFSFSQEKFVRADNDLNDIYYFHSEGVDYLASPIKLNGFLRDVKLGVLPFTGGIELIKEKVRRLESSPQDDKITVITGDWVRVLSPEGTNTPVHVLGFTGQGEDRKIHLFYLHSPLKNELFF
ncbi:MAG TPA: hypothetical protein VHP63_03820 [candidate division Zixibacteria bacterium]|nr:hypothetical protein [candidate division Zixibacteria bacterium]